MSVKQVIQLESSAVIGESISIPFEFSDRSSIPKGEVVEESIEITPITVRTWFALKPYLLEIDYTDLDNIIAKEGQPFSSHIAEIIIKYDNLLFEIVCIGIHNKKGKIKDWYRETLRDNCTWEDIFILVNAILFRLKYNPFLKSITLLNSVSPLDARGIIALQKNNESWNRKAPSCL